MGTREGQRRQATTRRAGRAASAWCCGCLLLACATPASSEPLGYFFRNVSNREPTTLLEPLPSSLSWLEGVSHYRLVPGTFPQGMDYHFDGLATLVRFRFSSDSVEYSVRAFESEAYRDYHHCDFFASGTGPTSVSRRPCLTNPVVNLAPLDNGQQLWLTIDTRFWGRMDPDTMETKPDRVDIPGTVLNAHPACDPLPPHACYVAYGCGFNPSSSQACISTLATSQGSSGHRLGVVNVSTSPALPKSKLLLHSHSPALTQSQVIVKLESFTPRFLPSSSSSYDEEEEQGSARWSSSSAAGGERGGVLAYLHQDEDDLFLVLNRSSNSSRLLRSSGFSFVNNHFWNAYDDTHLGGSVLDTIPATSQYLDTYFRDKLDQQATPWHRILLPPRRCLVPFEGRDDDTTIECKELIVSHPELVVDYPTYSPLAKTRKYRYFYAIAPHSLQHSPWFDSVVKVDAESGRVVAQWRGGQEGTYVTEADFVPRQEEEEAAAEGEEDDGVLLTVVYDSSSDSSSLVVLDAVALQQLAAFPLPGEPLSFHAHGEPSKRAGRTTHTETEPRGPSLTASLIIKDGV